MKISKRYAISAAVLTMLFGAADSSFAQYGGDYGQGGSQQGSYDAGLSDSGGYAPKAKAGTVACDEPTTSLYGMGGDCADDVETTGSIAAPRYVGPQPSASLVGPNDSPDYVVPLEEL